MYEDYSNKAKTAFMFVFGDYILTFTHFNFNMVGMNLFQNTNKSHLRDETKVSQEFASGCAFFLLWPQVSVVGDDKNNSKL